MEIFITLLFVKNRNINEKQCKNEPVLSHAETGF